MAMMLSAPSLLSTTISAITIGLAFSIRQLVTTPPTGVMAFSMSAAVVPGAKFCAMTTNGPARPRIVIPLLNAPPAAAIVGIDAEGLTCRCSDRIRACATCWARRCGGLEEAAPGAEIRLAREPGRGEARGVLGAECLSWGSWRSCVHSPLMSPAVAATWLRGPVGTPRYVD